MGKYSKFRGDPESKLLYVLDGLVGGINTEFSDDASGDTDFDNLINFDVDLMGTLTKRNGFGKLTGISAIFNNFNLGPDGLLPRVKNVTEGVQDPSKDNDNLLFIKLLQNDNNCFRNLSAFSGFYAYRDYQRMYGFQNNEFHLLILTVKDDVTTSWLYKCRLPELAYDYEGNEQLNEDGTPVETLTITCDKTILPIKMTHNKNLMNIPTVELGDDIYFTSNDKGLISFNRVTEEYTYYFKDEEIGITENEAFKPSIYDIQENGYNVLSDDPMMYYSGLSSSIVGDGSIEGAVITTESGVPVNVVPSGQSFYLYIYYTGADNGFTITTKSGGKDLSVNVEDAPEAETIVGRKRYRISFPTQPTGEVEFKVEKNEATIDAFYFYRSPGSVSSDDKKPEGIKVGDYGITEMYSRLLYYKDATIWFSDVNNYSYIPHLNSVTLSIEPTDKITKIVYFRGVYVIFTKNTIYKMVGTFGSADFAIEPINTSIGCHAGETVVTIENTIYFASPRGIYALKSSEYREGLENLTELDLKVKKLTSDYTMYNDELANPSIRFNGISERAYAFRYKNKYMLFYNSYYNEGDYAATNNIDVLVYDYILKNFTTYRFKEKPTFLFFNDGALQTFCSTLQNEEVLIPADEIVNYDLESQDPTSNVVLDNSGEENNGEIVGDVVTNQSSYQLGHLDYIETNAEGEQIFTDKELKLDLKLGENIEDKTIFELKSNEIPDEYADFIQDSLYSLDVEGYQLETIYTVRRINIYNETAHEITATFRLHKLSSDAPDVVSGKLKVEGIYGETILKPWLLVIHPTQGTTVKAPVGEIDYVADFSGSDVVEIYSNYGGCVDIDTNDTNYEFELIPSITIEGYKEETTYEVGAKIAKTTKVLSTEKSYIKIGIPYAVTAYNVDGKQYARCTVTKPFVRCTTSSMSVPSRTLKISFAGKSMSFTIPKLNGADDFKSSETKYVDVTYPESVLSGDGIYKITVKGSYGIKATLSGTYTENLTGSFSLTLPKMKRTTISAAVNAGIVMSCPVYMVFVEGIDAISLALKLLSDNTLRLICNTTEMSYILATPVIKNINNKHTIRLKGENSDLFLYINDEEYVLNLPENINLNYYKYNSDDILFGTDKDRTNYLNWEMFEIDFGAFKYNTVDNETVSENEVTLVDKSTNEINGTAYYSGTLEYPGLSFTGNMSYIKLPELDYDFSHGITLETEFTLDNVDETQILFDMATANKLASVNLEVSNKHLVFNSTKLNGEVVSIENPLTLEVGIRYTVKIMCKHNTENDTYTVDMFVNNNDVPNISKKFRVSPIVDVLRQLCYIGKSVNDDNYLKGQMFNFKLTISSYSAEIYDYGTFYEFGISYSDFGKPIYFEAVTKGINLQYPLHIKKLKHTFMKVKGGYKYNDLFFELYVDGHLTNDPKKYYCYVDFDDSIIYDYTVEPNISVEPRLSLLGDINIGKTKLGEGIYQTLKMITPAKGKNFKVRLYGDNKDIISLESFGFVSKLGKVKQD